MKIKNKNKNDEKDCIGQRPKISRTGIHLPLPQRRTTIGKVLVCGHGEFGQLGLGEGACKYERNRPTLLKGIKGVVDICAGSVHSLLLTNDGEVYSFGCNDEGALGRDTSEEGSEFVPKQVLLPSKALKLSAGDSHSACLLEDGRVFAWGSFRNLSGNMGLTLEGNQHLPVNMFPGYLCVDVASGANHIIILTDKGKVYTVGNGEQGQLGRVSLRTGSGNGRRSKTNLLQPQELTIHTFKPISEIWATKFCTFVREYKNGKIWACGLNNYQQLAAKKKDTVLVVPTLTNLQEIKQIAGGEQHTLMLKNNGEVLVIGRKEYGRLGLGNLTTDIVQLQRIDTLQRENITSICCGDTQSFALNEHGQLYGWGVNDDFQLGIGTRNIKWEPVLIESPETFNKPIIHATSGSLHTIILVADEQNTQVKEAAAEEQISDCTLSILKLDSNQLEKKRNHQTLNNVIPTATTKRQNEISPIAENNIQKSLPETSNVIIFNNELPQTTNEERTIIPTATTERQNETSPIAENNIKKSLPETSNANIFNNQLPQTTKEEPLSDCSFESVTRLSRLDSMQVAVSIENLNAVTPQAETINSDEPSTSVEATPSTTHTVSTEEAVDRKNSK